MGRDKKTKSDSAGCGDPRRDRGMSSVKSVAVVTALRKGPWEDRSGLQTSCVSPACVGVCTRTVDEPVTAWARGCAVSSVSHVTLVCELLSTVCACVRVRKPSLLLCNEVNVDLLFV